MKISITNAAGETLTATFRISTASTVLGELGPNAREIEAWRCPTERKTPADDLTLRLVIEEHEVDKIVGRLPKDAKHVATFSIPNDGASAKAQHLAALDEATAAGYVRRAQADVALPQIERDSCLRVVSLTAESAVAFFGLHDDDVERVEDGGPIDMTDSRWSRYNPKARHFRIYIKSKTKVGG